ncbi:hypothetical protein AOL_s00097g322 [Orbilia oligospora ATCC 24927]|uniref:Uncharacterized protein n=1 Tax=Arthrobotrys oligospora (strain ATCC 24927 / CBS 115.81 / DSM 1491) TaxID=756982 RepID=G1XIZ5_ARTOA|nr:hypothetical protein AOL_s00097g322 [Orbilia oligospora ATCC 24927]EGX46896.1 hypothetical protein AOL_s00097g322 [Orbilia oligospora ATCC 24927]
MLKGSCGLVELAWTEGPGSGNESTATDGVELVSFCPEIKESELDIEGAGEAFEPELGEAAYTPARLFGTARSMGGVWFLR